MTAASPEPRFVQGTHPIELVELLFALSRRHDQPFSVVAVELDSDSEHMERTLVAALRRTDLLVRWGDSARYTAFCPSTGAAGAKELAQRIWDSTPSAQIRCGIASFPQDAFGLADLIDAAFRNARSQVGADFDEDARPGDVHLVRRALPSQLEHTRERRFAAVAKRAFDVVVLVLGLPLWLPLFALTALVVKLSHPGAPVLFRQQRTGRGGRRFAMYKFRTMVPNAEAVKAELAHMNQLQWPDFKIENDPRITRLGRFLRKSSLDELPQVLNVIRGEMSWVGPRPTSFGAETYEIWQTARLDVIPGVTGLWQVEGRARTEFEERLRLDMEYIDRRSLLFDLEILFRTAREVFRPRGGY